MNIAIIGFDRQGRSAYDYWNNPDNKITICDRDTSIVVPQDAGSNLGDGYLSNLDSYDLIVRTPGLHPSLLINAGGEDILNKTTTVTNEFMRVCPTKNVIGITGTKGKGTTSTLVTKLLEANGHKVHLGGNIGTPPLDLLKDNVDPDDWVVLELANFQLIDLKYSPHIGVCLMVEPEHLDWHKDKYEYFKAKAQLFAHQNNQDIAIYFAPNETSKDIASSGGGKLIPFFSSPGARIENESLVIDNQSVMHVSEFALPGEHNWQNICAALTCTWQVDKNIEAYRKVLTTFSGLPFRIELRGEKNGIRFYNDSFSSQPAATIAAINTVAGNKVVIVGGKDRGLDLEDLAKTISSKSAEIRKVLIIGASAERVADSLKQAGFTNYIVSADKDIAQIVKQAVSLAKAGDSIVLSPGFPSFDMFKNFEVRGELFNKAVEAL